MEKLNIRQQIHEQICVKVYYSKPFFDTYMDITPSIYMNVHKHLKIKIFDNINDINIINIALLRR